MGALAKLQQLADNFRQYWGVTGKLGIQDMINLLDGTNNKQSYASTYTGALTALADAFRRHYSRSDKLSLDQMIELSKDAKVILVNDNQANIKNNYVNSYSVNSSLASGYVNKQLKITVDYQWSGLAAGAQFATTLLITKGQFIKGDSGGLDNNQILLCSLLPSDGKTSGAASVQVISKTLSDATDGNISAAGISVYNTINASIQGTFTINHIRIEVIDAIKDPVVTREMTPKFNGALSNVQSTIYKPLDGLGGLLTKYRSYQKPISLYFDFWSASYINQSREYSVNISATSDKAYNYLLRPQVSMQVSLRYSNLGYYRVVFKIPTYLDLSPLMKYASAFTMDLIGKNMGQEIIYVRNIGVAPADEGLVSEEVNHYVYDYSLDSFGYHGCHLGGSDLTMHGNSWDDQINAVATDMFLVHVVVDEGGYHGQSYFYSHNMKALVPGYYTFSGLVQWKNTGVDFKVIRGNDQNGQLVDEALIANSSSSKNSWDGVNFDNYKPVKYTFYVNQPGHYTLSISSTSAQDRVDIVLPSLERGRWATGAMGGTSTINQWYCAGGYQQSQSVYTQPTVKTSIENNKVDFTNLTNINNLAYDQDKIVYDDRMNQSTFKWATNNSTISYNNSGWLDVSTTASKSSICNKMSNNPGTMDLIIWARVNPNSGFDSIPLFVDNAEDQGQGCITIDSYEWKPYTTQVSLQNLWMWQDTLDGTIKNSAYKYQIARIVGLQTQR